MAKTCSPELEAHLRSNVTTLCTCWKVTRTDGVQLGFTDHVKDLYVDGQVFVAASGYTRTAIASNSGLAVDNMDLEGLLAGGGITVEDCRAGVYDYAEVEVSLVNYNDSDMGKLILRRGKLGEVQLKDGIFHTEIRGLVQALARNFMEVVTPDCRYEVGTPPCGVDMTQFTTSGTITTVVTPRRSFVTDLTAMAGYYTGGELMFTSGKAAGRSMEIKAHGPAVTYIAEIANWGKTNDADYTEAIVGGPVILTTGPSGQVIISAQMTFMALGNIGETMHMKGRWRWRTTGVGPWTNGTEGTSSGTVHDQGDVGAFNWDQTLTLTPDTEYEFEFQARRGESGSNYIQFYGSAILRTDTDPSGDITLFLPMNWDIEVGDTFDIKVGCDGIHTTCKVKFDNLVNFGGFPDLPGMDAIIKTPDYREAEVDS